MTLAIGCQKEEIKNNEVIENTGYTRTLTVGVADEADTRVGFDEDNAFYWHEGDMIGVRTESGFQVMTLLEEYDHQASGVFGGDFEGEMGEYVVYPHNAYHGISDAELIYVLPSSYKYSSIEDDANSFNAPMLGKITDGKATLNHLASFFKIIVKNLPAGGDDMTFTFTADKRITGEFRTDPREELPEIKTDGSTYDNIVTISFTNNDAGADGYFYIPAPLGTYGSITVEVKDGAEILVTKTWENQTVKRKTPKRGTIPVGFVAEINGKRYVTLKDAIDEVEEGGTITMVADEVFTETNCSELNGWYEGLYYSGDKSLTIDLGGFTITQDNKKVNDYLLLFKNDGEKANTITLKNGTIDAGTTAYSALATTSTNNQKMTFNLENINLIGNNSNGSVVKFRGGGELNVNAGTVITGKDSYLGIEVGNEGTIVNIYEGVEIYQQGTSSYLGGIVGTCHGSTLNICGGKGQSAKSGIVAMSSGGYIYVKGGEWKAEGDVLTVNNDSGHEGYMGASNIYVYGGSFEGGLSAWTHGDPIEYSGLEIYGGNFGTDPSEYAAEDYTVYEEDGLYKVFSPVEDGISDAAQMFAFAKMVNSGNSFSGKTVELKADINLENKSWTPIGSAYLAHGFCGNFEGNNKTIKNLLITEITPDEDGYVYAGLFGVTEGTETDRNYIQNLSIENVEIETDGHIVAAAIAYPYYTTVANITVKGNVDISGGNYTAGVLAYTRRCVDAKNLVIAADPASAITGKQTVGGVISDIQMNGGLIANYSDFKASGLIITGEKYVGGISGIISSQTLDGATVENVSIECNDARRGTVSGALGGKSVIKNVSVTDVTGADNVVGATYDEANEVVVDGDVYDKAKTNN